MYPLQLCIMWVCPLKLSYLGVIFTFHDKLVYLSCKTKVHTFYTVSCCSLYICLYLMVNPFSSILLLECQMKGFFVYCHMLKSYLIMIFLLRFINARRRILQPMLDSNTSYASLNRAKKIKPQKVPAQRAWPESIGVYSPYHSTDGLQYHTTAGIHSIYLKSLYVILLCHVLGTPKIQH